MTAGILELKDNVFVLVGILLLLFGVVVFVAWFRERYWLPILSKDEPPTRPQVSGRENQPVQRQAAGVSEPRGDAGAEPPESPAPPPLPRRTAPVPQ